MKVQRTMGALGLVLGLALLTAVPAAASRWDQKTNLIVHETIQIPGATLEPGHYTMQLVDSMANRHIVRFSNENDTNTIATVIAIPNRRLEATGDTKFRFYETPAGEPPALRAWFYPGNLYGQEFTYPEEYASKISEQANLDVPAVSDEDMARLHEQDRTAQTEPWDKFESMTEEEARKRAEEDPYLVILREVEVYRVNPEGERSELTASASSKTTSQTTTSKQSASKHSASETTDRNEVAAAKSTSNVEGDHKSKNANDQKGAKSADDESASAESSRFASGFEVEDTRLARQVRKELVTLPYYSVWDTLKYQIEEDGTVVLLGKVHRPTLKSAAERVVLNIEGVKEVRNEIEVLPVSGNDDRIRRAVYEQVYSHPALQRYSMRAVPPIHIIVEDGDVALEGIVGNKMDKNIAGIEARSVNGVFSVENNLRVEG